MTAINFPDSPSIGQIYTVNNLSWQWDGTVWNAYPMVYIIDGGTP